MGQYFSEKEAKTQETREVRVNSILKKSDLEGLKSLDNSLNESKDSADEHEEKIKKEKENQQKLGLKEKKINKSTEISLKSINC